MQQFIYMHGFLHALRMASIDFICYHSAPMNRLEQRISTSLQTICDSLEETVKGYKTLTRYQNTNDSIDCDG